MTPDHFFDYLEAKAKQHPDIPHNPEQKKVAFYAVDDPYDLSEFDNALRNFSAFPAMIAEQNEGELNDNQSANYTDTIEGAFMIVDERRNREAIRAVRNRCWEIGKAILVQMRKDARPDGSGGIMPGRLVHFRIDGVGYAPVGPMATKYYGYVFSFRFACPFSF